VASAEEGARVTTIGGRVEAATFVGHELFQTRSSVVVT